MGWTGWAYIHRRGEGGKGMLAGDWCQTGACSAHAGWVTGGDGVVVMTWGGGGK